MRNKHNWQFVSNTIATMVNLLIQFGLNFFLTSYLISSVGSTAYGFFTMANTVVNYALIITTALNSMAARFIGIGVHNNDMEKARKFYSSVFAGDFSYIKFRKSYQHSNRTGKRCKGIVLYSVLKHVL